MKIFINYFIKIFVIIYFFSNQSVSDDHKLSDSDVLFKKAYEFFKSKKYNEAFPIFEKLANNSEHDAQYNLAYLLKEGKGITKKYSESLYWAFLSKLGNIEKADDLVSELVDLVPEKTVETVREEVKNYLIKSIESGSQTSIMHLGKFFLEVVEEKEYSSAYKWFTVLVLENFLFW